MDPKEVEKYMKMAQDGAITFVPKLLLAIAIFIVGRWVIRKIMKLTQIGFEKAELSKEIQSFLGTTVRVILMVVLVFIVASTVGVNTASFMALFAAAGLGVGLALQGSLGNFAAGIIILLFKPYRVGDWVEIQEKFGRVEDMQIFNTIVKTPGNKVLIIPNGQVIEGIVTNYSLKENIRMELEALIPYSESYPKVEQLLIPEIMKIDGVLQDPAPEIGINEFDSHYIKLSVRPYVKPSDYWNVRFTTNQTIKRVFHENGIQMAYTEGMELGEIGA